MMLYPKRLRIVRGDVRDTSRVEKAVAGQDALMSTLGNTKTSRREAQAEGIKNTVNDAMRIIWSLLKLLQKDVLE